MQRCGVICNSYMCVTAIWVAIHLQHILLVIGENFVPHKHHFDVGREVCNISCDMRVNDYDVPRLEYVCVVWFVMLKHHFDVGREVGNITCDMCVNDCDVPRLEYVCVIWF